MHRVITLPEGHSWEEQDAGAAVKLFTCNCGATFTHDLQDGSIEFEDAYHEPLDD